MKRKLLSLIVGLSSGLILSSQAQADEAGLFLEPGVTYEMGSTKTDWRGVGESTGHADGLGAAFRLGFHIADIFFVGADARYAKVHFKDSSVSYSADANSTQYAPVVGVQTPLLGIRVWGAYVLGGDLDPDKSGNYNVKWSTAKGYRLGAGLYVAMISLNLEYEDLKYDKLSGTYAGLSGSIAGVKPTNKSWIASVSFPIAL